MVYLDRSFITGIHIIQSSYLAFTFGDFLLQLSHVAYFIPKIQSIKKRYVLHSSH